MKHAEGHLTLPESSAGAGAKLFYQSWTPSAAPKAVMLLVHGYAEHSGRYADFAAFCNESSYAVYALDHWGHGQSDGDYGFVPRFSAFLDGIDALLAAVKQDHPDRPLVLVGHSMGGLISTLYLQRNQAPFCAAVLSGPAIKAAEEPSAFMLGLSRFLSRFLPKTGVLALDSQGVSRDPDVVQKYLDDPLVYNGKMSARLAAEMLQSMTDAQNGLSEITLPIMFLHGAEDTLAAPEGSTIGHAGVSSNDKAITIYPALYHEIFNEPERVAVMTDMTDWLQSRVPAA